MPVAFASPSLAGVVISHQTDLRPRHASVEPGSRLDSPKAAPTSPRSLELIQSAAAHLLDLGSSGDTALPTTDTGHDVLQTGANAEQGVGTSPASDGIFMPGSAYLQFHSALRNHTFHAARSTFPSRCGSPERPVSQHDRDALVEFAPPIGAPILDTTVFEDASLSTLSVPTPASVELSQQHEYELWKNWVDEIAPWVRVPSAQKRFSALLLLVLAQLYLYIYISWNCFFLPRHSWTSWTINAISVAPCPL